MLEMFRNIFVYMLLNLAFSQAFEAPRNGFFKREFSLSKPYTSGGLTMPFWDLRDDALVTNNYIRLTTNLQDEKGAIWNKAPCHLRDWELQIVFKVHGGGRSLGADGMAVWLTETRMVSGSVFGSMDGFKGLGIFLDTYKNGNEPVTFPQISGVVANGSVEYDHNNDGAMNSIGACLGSFRNKDYDTAIAIRYSKQVLTVKIDVDDLGEWRTCFAVAGVVLPTGYFFGVSAATGDLADNHDVISLKLYQLDVERTQEELLEDWSSFTPEVKPNVQLNEYGGEVQEQAKPGSGLFFSLFVIIVICVCIVVGLIVYKKRQDSSRKHFY